MTSVYIAAGVSNKSGGGSGSGERSSSPVIASHSLDASGQSCVLSSKRIASIVIIELAACERPQPDYVMF